MELLRELGGTGAVGSSVPYTESMMVLRGGGGGERIIITSNKYGDLGPRAMMIFEMKLTS